MTEPNAPQLVLPPGLIVRDARVPDLDPVVEFLKPFVEAKHILPRNLGEMQLLLANGFVGVREADQAVIGFAAVEVYSRKMAEVQCLAVDSQYRGVGVGRKLVERCVERARKLRIRELMAITASDKFLMDCGFGYSLPDQKRALFVQTFDGVDERADD